MSEAVELLRELATKLGTTVETLWPHAIRYVVIEGLCSIVFTVLFLLIFGIILYKLRNSSWLVDDEYPSMRFIVAGVFSFFLIISCIVIPCDLPKILEPTGYLVYNILR